MKSISLYVFVILGFFIVTVYSAWYISPSGSDNNAGTQSAPFATLNHALTVVSTSSDHDIIFLSGTYTGETVRIADAVNITSLAGSKDTILEDFDITISGALSSSVQNISGLTFQNCATLNIQYNTIISSSVIIDSSGSPAIKVMQHAYLHLSSSTVTQNQKGGILCSGVCTIVLTKITENTGTKEYAGGITFWPSTGSQLGSISHSFIDDNENDYIVPAGIMVINTSVLIENSTFTGNKAKYIASWSCQNSALQLLYTTFSNNVASNSSGYGVGYCSNCDLSLLGNTLNHNTPPPSGICEGWERRPYYDLAGGNVANYDNIETEEDCAYICYINPRSKCNGYVYGTGGGFQKQCYIKHPSTAIWSYQPNVNSAFWQSL